jgi:ribosomal protein S18 acetylase RimI-like enzyme
MPVINIPANTLNHVTYTHRLSVEDYNSLRSSVGWGTFSMRQVQAALSGCNYLIVAEIDNRPVGMSRVMLDGTQAYVMDVIVRPEHQKSGIGKALMERLLAYIFAQLEENEKIMINLMAAMGKEGFYEKLGFSRRPNEIQGAGMTQWLSKA